jgi:hypothetical protein
MPLAPVLTALAAAALAAASGPHLDVSPGLWEAKVTSVLKMQGGALPDPSSLPPEMRARVEEARKRLGSGAPQTHVSRSCVTQEQIEKDDFLEDMSKQQGCTRKILDRTARHIRFTMHCEEGKVGFAADGEWELTVQSQEAVVVHGQMRGAGDGGSGSSTMDMTARRVGSSCGDLKPGESRTVGSGG